MIGFYRLIALHIGDDGMGGQIIVVGDGKCHAFKGLGQLLRDIDIDHIIHVGIGVNLKGLIALKIHSHIEAIHHKGVVDGGCEIEGAVGDGAGAPVFKMSLQGQQLVAVFHIQGSGRVLASAVGVFRYDVNGVKRHKEQLIVNGFSQFQRCGFRLFRLLGFFGHFRFLRLFGGFRRLGGGLLRRVLGRLRVAGLGAAGCQRQGGHQGQQQGDLFFHWYFLHSFLGFPKHIVLFSTKQYPGCIGF